MDTDDVLNRIFDKLDGYDERLNTTCNTISKIEEKLSNFIDRIEKKSNEDRIKTETRFKIITAVFGCITSVSVIVALARSFF
jgi:hypothetical protein